MKPTGRTVLDVATRADKELDKLLNRAAERLGEARAGQHAANELEAAWAESERRVRAERREANRLAWVEHYRRMTVVHLEMARDFRRLARAMESIDLKESA
jgi:hypothetical protein